MKTWRAALPCCVPGNMQDCTYQKLSASVHLAYSNAAFLRKQHRTTCAVSAMSPLPVIRATCISWAERRHDTGQTLLCFVRLSDKPLMLSDNKPSITCYICVVGITEETFTTVDVLGRQTRQYVCPHDARDAVEGSFSSQWIWQTGALSARQRTRRWVWKRDAVCTGQGELCSQSDVARGSNDMIPLQNAGECLHQCRLTYHPKSTRQSARHRVARSRREQSTACRCARMLLSGLRLTCRCLLRCYLGIMHLATDEGAVPVPGDPWPSIPEHNAQCRRTHLWHGEEGEYGKKDSGPW